MSLMTAASGVRLTRKQEREIDTLVKIGLYVSMSEFIRDAVREKLASIKVMRIRENIGLQQAEREVFGFLTEHQEAYASDISEALGLDIELVFEVLRRLKAEGKVE